jgi:hypothetical protein
MFVAVYKSDSTTDVLVVSDLGMFVAVYKSDSTTDVLISDLGM